MLNGLLIFLVINLIIIVHELGHFLIAKSLGEKPKTFAVGFGKALFRKEGKNGTQYRINWLPLGGYVEFDMDSLTAKPPFKRFWIMMGGVLFNFLFAALLCFVYVIIMRVPFSATPVDDSWGVWQAFSYTGQSVYEITQIVTNGFVDLFFAPKMDSLAGPVQLIRDGAIIVSQNIISIIPLTAMVSINVMVFNLLPFPSLDGSRLVFIVFEILFRRPIKAEKYFHAVGLVLLLLFMLALLGKDVFVVFTQQSPLI